MADNDNKLESSRYVHLTRLVPNMVTILGLCIGLSAIRFAFREQWEPAVGFVILASCIDGLDGRLARMLNATSEFGAQLDSLADFINFGVAPPFVLYLWITHDIKGLGWALVLFFSVCAAIRLARFNTELERDEEPPEWKKRFFSGMPAPAGAMVALGPMTVSFAFKEDFPSFFEYISFVENPLFVCVYAGITAALMASQVPTFSFKKIAVQKKYASLILVGVGLFIISAFTEPWLTMVGVGLWYYVTIPMSIIAYNKLDTKS